MFKWKTKCLHSKPFYYFIHKFPKLLSDAKSRYVCQTSSACSELFSLSNICHICLSINLLSKYILLINCGKMTLKYYTK